tara:strand:+ start:1274 stop:2011 length:738 start_codon:yes stop_codon:yes gene_type:complete
MPFIGNQPALSFTSFAKQDFTTSATTSYTLDNPVSNQNELALFINNVRQKPTTSYSASGTTLTLTEATSSSDDMYCVYLGKAVQTVNPPNNSVGTSQLVDGAVTSSKLSSGKVLQVVQGSNEGVVTTTSTSFVDITSVTASITPISTSNKIMVIYSSGGFYPLVAGTNVTYHHQVLRDSTVLGTRRITYASGAGGLQGRGSMSFTILDSPSSTATLVYKAQHKISSSSSSAQASDTSIVLMEVSA